MCLSESKSFNMELYHTHIHESKIWTGYKMLVHNLVMVLRIVSMQGCKKYSNPVIPLSQKHPPIIRIRIMRIIQ